MTLKFQRGVNRANNVDPKFPYSLKNARLTKYGQVAAVKTPATSGSDLVSQGKPWREWDGEYYDCNRTETDPIDGSTSMQVYDYEVYSKQLYGTAFANGTNRSTNYLNFKYKEGQIEYPPTITYKQDSQL